MGQLNMADIQTKAKSLLDCLCEWSTYALMSKIWIRLFGTFVWGTGTWFEYVLEYLYDCCIEE